jgi:hypothetical protein
MPYKIVRMYRDSAIRERTICRGLTLEKAQKHCQDPETASFTCRKPANTRRTKIHGPWFDWYTEE